jgi:hypothetical protein
MMNPRDISYWSAAYPISFGRIAQPIRDDYRDGRPVPEAGTLALRDRRRARYSCANGAILVPKGQFRALKLRCWGRKRADLPP